MFNIQCSIFNVQCPIFNVQYSMFNVQHHLVSEIFIESPKSCVVVG